MKRTNLKRVVSTSLVLSMALGTACSSKAPAESTAITTLGDVGDISYIESIYNDYGPVDVVINNAAVAYIRLLTDMTPDEWSHIINTNITSLYNTSHTYTPFMIRQHSGHIINISSVWGRSRLVTATLYPETAGISAAVHADEPLSL